jgi:hypothetical protein
MPEQRGVRQQVVGLIELHTVEEIVEFEPLSNDEKSLPLSVQQIQTFKRFRREMGNAIYGSASKTRKRRSSSHCWAAFSLD